MEVKRIIDKALEQVRHVISERRDALEAITKSLIEQETLDGEEFKQLMEENSKGARIVPGTEVEPKRVDDAPEENASGPASNSGT